MDTLVIASSFSGTQRDRIVRAAAQAFGQTSQAVFEPLDADVLPQAGILVGSFAPQAVARLSADADTAPHFIQLTSAGYEKYLREGVLAPATILANASGAFDQEVAEHSLAVLMGLFHKLELYRDNQDRHVWKDEGPVVSISGARLLVIGKGHIGARFARLATALGARVTGFRRHVPSGANSGVAISTEGRTETMDALPHLLATADAVVSFLPSTPQTRGFYDERFFAALRPGTFFVNAGRGDAVRMPALLDALRSGRLAGAGLDVTDPEPLPADDPLWSQPNVVITPHVAGGWRLPGVAEKLCDLACVNITRFARHEPALNQVAGPGI